MNKTLAIAMLISLTASAQAGQTFSMKFNDARISLAMPDNCDRLSCLSVSINGMSPAEPAADAPVPSPHDQLPAKAPTRSDAAAETSQETRPEPPRGVPPAPAAPAPFAQQAPVASQVVVAPAARGDERVQVTAVAPSVDATSPIGVWRTENHEGEVRIVACGAMLCGYVFNNGTDGEKVLLDMKASSPTAWHGKIRDPRGYGTYTSTLTLVGTDRITVRGCAFGNMVCGSQTWSRV